MDQIIKDVHNNGDKALFSYTKEFDKADINEANIKVTEEEIKKLSRLIINYLKF